MVVYFVGGWVVLMGVIIFGLWIGKYNGDRVMELFWFDFSFVVFGIFILWFGWFGFNGVFQFVMGMVGDIVDIFCIFVNINVVVVGGVFLMLILFQFFYDKLSFMVVFNGVFGGFVVIIVELFYLLFGVVILIGGFGGIIVVFVIIGLDKLKIDDVVGVILVYLVCGIWGIIVVVIINLEVNILL